MVMDEDTVASVMLLASETTEPPTGAGPERVTVPVEVFPPTTEVGLSAREDSVGEITARFAFTDVLPTIAVIVSITEATTADVGMVNVAEVAPALTVTVAGGVALNPLEVRLTSSPPGGAGSFSVTVPCVEVPPMTEVGETVRVFGTGEVMVSVADILTPPAEAEMVTGVEVVTPEVEMPNVALVAPAATSTEPGVTALELVEDRSTTMPPAGAARLRVTVPVDGEPPVTEAGESEREAGTGSTTSRVAEALTPPDDAATTTVVEDETVDVVMGKAAVVAPAGTKTKEGSDTEALPPRRFTSLPPVGAAFVRVTVPTALWPLATMLGLMAKLLIGTVLT
jgi:hypothetical protein